MTGTQFEHEFCRWLQNRGYWALNIPRSPGGAQPFDIVAMRGNFTVVADCKVMSGKSLQFPLQRIEDNQWLAFQSCKEKTSAFRFIAVYHVEKGQMYIIPFDVFETARKNDLSSVFVAPEYDAATILIQRERYLW